MPGKAHGVALIEDAALRGKVLTFTRESMPPPGPFERWSPAIGGGVVLLLLVVAGVVVLRWRVRRNTTTAAADVIADS
ncbi:hypothetical protein FXN61_32480 [Lentzea sp. PSKA42]|uniref:Uncharacterized protein n=1 Tax=Lentzea indica TaxID=2604800 RepID=A0ABX1FRP1_9PSEU|nr:hypothetical protein [Lentzea indica]NKE61237.1 hypothetical protein [Lentzea indica]